MEKVIFKLNKTLSNTILKMAEIDQKVRFDGLRAKNKKRVGLKIISIDKRNTQKAKEIIRKYGWPSFDLVGKRASNAFWLIIQHADLDMKFQAECLSLLKRAVKDEQAHPKCEAYLTDRVLVNQAKKQLYGTQFYRDKRGSLVPRPIEDMKNLNKRRKFVGLKPFKEHLKEMKEMGKEKRH